MEWVSVCVCEEQRSFVDQRGLRRGHCGDQRTNTIVSAGQAEARQLDACVAQIKNSSVNHRWFTFCEFSCRFIRTGSQIFFSLHPERHRWWNNHTSQIIPQGIKVIDHYRNRAALSGDNSPTVSLEPNQITEFQCLQLDCLQWGQCPPVRMHPLTPEQSRDKSLHDENMVCCVAFWESEAFNQIEEFLCSQKALRRSSVLFLFPASSVTVRWRMERPRASGTHLPDFFIFLARAETDAAKTVVKLK